MKKIKRLLAGLMAATMVMGMSVTAFAEEDQDASFTKTYKITNEGTINPSETFTFECTPYRITDTNKNLTVANMPSINISPVEFEQGTATISGLEKTVNVDLSDIVWPGVGVYYYEVKETAGSAAGVVYDDTIAYLKVTVAYDEGTGTYYTAFTTLNLADSNGDKITDDKIAGFTNVYNAGSLSIKKTVTGNLGDQSAYFAVKVTLTGESGKTYAESYDVVGGSYAENADSIKIDEETTFYLKHDETITISNLPYGITYTVVEEDYTSEEKGKYEEAAYDYDADEDTDEETTLVIDDATDKVVITNQKGVVVDTGISLDNMPYILVLALVALGLAGFVFKKRSTEF